MEAYDKYIVFFSGGKDSTALFLHLLEIGIPVSKIELWHHEIDGKGEQFMDWECTKSYCEAFAKQFNVPIYFSWKEGGFKREMLREDSATAPIFFQIPEEEYKANHRIQRFSMSNGFYGITGGNGPTGTRLKFPQVSPDLSVRWCSPYLKIDVGATAIRNQIRFNSIKTIVLSGERGEESTARGNYEILERDRSDLRDGKKFQRWVDRWRPIRDWSEKQIWDIIKRHSIRVHPAYYLGYGRVSCKFCIFGNKNQFATSYAISPEQGEKIIRMEEKIGCTIKRNTGLRSLIESGTPYPNMDKEAIAAATSYDYTLSIIHPEWKLPAGAFGDKCGPE